MNDSNEPKQSSKTKRAAATVGLYALWFIWVAVIQPIKITTFIGAPLAREDIEFYAMVGGIVKALLVVGPYWVIRSIQRKL